jgi:hypothetical protein
MAVEGVCGFLISTSLGKVHRNTSSYFVSQKKIVCFLGVKLTLSSQETVKDFYTILGSVILQARIFQTKKPELSIMSVALDILT